MHELHTCKQYLHARATCMQGLHLCRGYVHAEHMQRLLVQSGGDVSAKCVQLLESTLYTHTLSRLVPTSSRAQNTVHPRIKTSRHRKEAASTPQQNLFFEQLLSVSLAASWLLYRRGPRVLGTRTILSEGQGGVGQQVGATIVLELCGVVSDWLGSNGPNPIQENKSVRC